MKKYTTLSSILKLLNSGEILRDKENDYWKISESIIYCYTNKTESGKYYWLKIDSIIGNDTIEQYKPFTEITELEEELYL